MSQELEEGLECKLDFTKLAKLGQAGQQVIPVVLQDADSKEVLYIAYMNELSLQETLKLKQVVLWSTSRNKIWHKGATSGDYLNLVDIRVNCEQNSLLILCRPVQKGACHTKDSSGQTRPNCYYRRVVQENDSTKLKHF